MTKSKAALAADTIDWDKRLAKAARQMIDAGRAGQSLLPVLVRNCPEVYRQLTTIAAQPKLLSLWGRSENIDEFANQDIVDLSILRLIAEITGQDMTPPAVHAGLQHTYGYLFSLIDTPFGFKRERWTRPAVEAGFGFEKSTLRVNPAAGTLLANLTYFIGRIALRGRRNEMAMLRQHKSIVAPCLTSFNYGALERTSIVERPKPTSRTRAVEIQTDLVRFPHATINHSHFLVYWITDSSERTAKLITAFPINQRTYDELTRQPQGQRVSIRARYNGIIPGLSGQEQPGSRQIG